MAATASLGPIDPQIIKTSKQGQRLVPAQVIVEAFKQMIAAAQQAIQQNLPPDPFLHVLDSLDVTAVLESMKAHDATKSIARGLLADGLLRNAREAIDKVVRSLVTEGEKELHGKHLYPPVLTSEIGIPVTVLPAGAELDVGLRNLFVRIETYANAKAIAKCFVTRTGGVDVNIQVR